jgi:hypothetical protein
MPIIKQRIPKSCTYPIVNITIASNPIEPVIRDSDEALGRNIGNMPIPLIIAPMPKDPSRNPNPMESNPSSPLAKSGKRDNSELPHIANKPARTITTWAA